MAASTGGLSLLLSCCGGGLAGALSVLLGTMALERIRASRGTLAGRWLAWTGIALGALAFLLSALLVWGVGELQERWDAQLDRGLRATFASHAEGDGESALESWVAPSGRSVDAANIHAFASDARARYGALDSYRILSEERDPDFMRGTQRVMLAIAFEFERARMNGSVVAQLVPPPAGVVPELRIESIVLSDLDAGELAIPNDSAASGDGGDADRAPPRGAGNGTDVGGGAEAESPAPRPE